MTFYSIFDLSAENWVYHDKIYSVYIYLFVIENFSTKFLPLNFKEENPVFFKVALRDTFVLLLEE